MGLLWTKKLALHWSQAETASLTHAYWLKTWLALQLLTHERSWLSLYKAHFARNNSAYTISFIFIFDVTFIDMCGPLCSSVLEHLYFALKGRHTGRHHIQCLLSYLVLCRDLKKQHQKQNSFLEMLLNFHPQKIQSRRYVFIPWLNKIFLNLAFHVKL